MPKIEIKTWTHWKNEKEKRLFLVVDIHHSEGVIVVMEVKYYKAEEERTFTHIPVATWDELIEKETLQEYIPRII